MTDIIVNNYLLLLALLGLLFLLFFNRVLNRKTILIFTVICSITIFLLIAEILDIYFGRLNAFCIWRAVVSSFGYIARPFIILLFIEIVNRRKKTSKALYMLLIAEAILVVTSQFTHLVVYYDQSNYFHRGILGFLPHILSGVYMFIMLFNSFYNQKKVDAVDATGIGIIIYIEFACISAVVFETVFGYRLLLIHAMASSTIGYYVFLNTSINKHDQLTGVLNRRCFFLDIEYRKNTAMAIISCDINGLKKINDTQGHEAGDTAICAVTDALCQATKKGFKVYRVGGDEFVVIGLKKATAEITDYIDKAKSLLDKTPYQMSFGYAIYHPGDNFDEIYRTSDERMYEDKRALKGATK